MVPASLLASDSSAGSGIPGFLQAAGMDAGISQGGYDSCFGFRSQGRNRTAVFGMFLNM